MTMIKQSIVIPLVKKLKKYLDFLYYEKYHIQERWEMIRTSLVSTWQWEEYKELEKLIKQMWVSEVNNMKEILMSFYRWEVTTLVDRSRKDPTLIQHIKKYDWIIEFCEAVTEYSELVFNNQSN